MKLINSHLLRTTDDYQAAMLALTEQASRTIRIRSSRLDRELFNSIPVNTLLSAFARRSRFSRVEILIDYPETLMSYHCLTLELARRLSAKIIIKEYFDSDQHGKTDSIVLIDQCGILIKPQGDDSLGQYSLTDAKNTQGLLKTFEHNWGMSSVAHQIRQLNLG